MVLQKTTGENPKVVKRASTWEFKIQDCAQKLWLYRCVAHGTVKTVCSCCGLAMCPRNQRRYVVRWIQFAVRPADRALVGGAVACAADFCSRTSSALQKDFEEAYGECPECGEDRPDWRYEIAEMGRAMRVTEGAWAKYRDAKSLCTSTFLDRPRELTAFALPC
jgi:hypothetical protein